MTTGGGWKHLVLILLLAALTPANAGPGDLVWSDSKVPGYGVTGVLAKQGLVVVAGEGLAIRIYDPANGRLRREHVFTEEGRPGSQAVVHGGSVIVLVRKDAAEWPRTENHLVAIHLATGRVRWRHFLGLRPEYDGYAFRPVSIAAFGHRLYVSNQGEPAVALDARTGRVLWRDGHEGVTAIAARRGQVAIAGFETGFETPVSSWPRFFVRMLDSESGRLRWADRDELGSPLGAFASAVAFARDHVVVGGWVDRMDPAYDGDNYDDPLLLAYDTDSGQRHWTKEAYLANDERVQRLLTREGRLFALIDVKGSWRLEAHDVQTGEALWQSELLLLDSALPALVIARDALHMASEPFTHPATLLIGGIRTRDGAVGWRRKSQTDDSTLYNVRALAADNERLYVVGGAWDAEQGPRQAIWAYALR